MANPGEQPDLGQQIAAKWAEHTDALARVQRTAQELQALMMQAGIVLPAAGVTLGLDTVEEPADERPFPGFFSTREATAMTATANYESTNSFDDAVAAILSPYKTKMQLEFAERWSALSDKPKVPRIPHTLPWRERNHPMDYNFALEYQVLRSKPQLHKLTLTQTRVEGGTGSLTTEVDARANDINAIQVNWRSASFNPPLPESFYENLGSRNPKFDDYYQRLIVGTSHNITHVWTNNSLYFRLGKTAKDCEMGFTRTDANTEFVIRYRYHEDLAGGPAFVRSAYRAQKGETPAAEKISIDEFLGWLRFALSTIPPSDLPIGPRVQRPTTPEQP